MSDLTDAVLAGSRPRNRPPTYTEFSATLRLPAGPLRGHKYNPGSDTCQRYLLEQFDSGKWERIYVCAPPQYGGKTLTCVLVPLLRNAISLRLPVGYGLPTLQDLDKAWSEKLKPALLKSGYEGHLPTAGPGARGGRGHTLAFTDPDSKEAEGMIVFLAGGAYGSTVAAVAIDEVDQFRTSDGSPMWGAIEDIFNRANAYGRKALRIAVGTVEHDTQSIILPLVNEQGTGTRPWPKCPHCGRYQTLEWDRVSYDGSDEDSVRKTAGIRCEHCAALWSESDRQTAMRAALFCHRGQSVDAEGAIIGEAPKTSSLGIVWTALESSLADLGDVCLDHYRAQSALALRNDHGLVRKFWRYRLCAPYAGDQLSEDSAPNQLTRGLLVARSSASTYGPIRSVKETDGDGTHQSTDCPQEVEGLVLSCDVQRGGQKAPGRLYFLLTGITGAFRTFDLAWGSLALAPIGAAPNTSQLHAGLDRLHAMGNALAREYGKDLVRRGVDVGDRQDEIRAWLSRRPEWWPVKGLSSGMKAAERWDIADWIYRREQEGRWWLYFVDTSPVRRQAQMQFLVPGDQPGSAHVPQGVIGTDSIVRHYCGTAEVPDGRGGTRWSERDADRKWHPEWQRRIDLLDCRTYALALAYQWVKELDRKRSAEDYIKTMQKQPQTEPGEGWLDGFRGDSWNL